MTWIYNNFGIPELGKNLKAKATGCLRNTRIGPQMLAQYWVHSKNPNVDSNGGNRLYEF